MNGYRRRSNLRMGYKWSDGVKILIIINACIFILTFLLRARFIYEIFGLVPAEVFSKFRVWQFVTYMFLHGGFFHILFNMFILWMFGSVVERTMGTTSFIKYFFITGIGAGLFNWVFSINSHNPIIGASGAIYGILVAFALFYPNATILLYFIIPVKAKYLAIGAAVIEFISSFSRGSGIAHLAHLGGMVVGFVYIKYGNFITAKLDKFTFFQMINSMFSSIKNIFSDGSSSSSTQSEQDLSDKKKIIDMVDIILDKINKNGYQSLSDQERRILKKASDILSDDEKK